MVLVEFLDEIPLFNVEYILGSKSVGKSLGIISEQEVESFFRAIEGRRSVDWFYTGNVRVEWYDTWSVADDIRSHLAYRVLPLAGMPPTIFSTRRMLFDSMRSQRITRSEMTGKWFEQQSQRRSDESDLEFEHRIVKTLATVFTIIKNRNSTKASPDENQSKPIEGAKL